MSHESPPNMQKPLKEAIDHLKHKRWGSASTIFDMILQVDPDCDIARAGKIMVQYHISTIETLPKCEKNITAEEQKILITAFADTQTDMTSILDLYRMNISSVHDKAKKHAYKRAKKKAKSCHFIPKKFKPISGARCDFLYEYDFESLNLSCLEINKAKYEFQSFDKYKDSDQCAELCGLTNVLISKASNFIPRTKWAKNFPLFKFFGFLWLLYFLSSWIVISYYISVFFSSGQFMINVLYTNPSLIVFSVFSILLTYYFVFKLLDIYENCNLEVFFSCLRVILILFFLFLPLFSPIISTTLFTLVIVRLIKQHQLIKNFTACNAELIQRMKVLSKQCSMLNPKRILRELF